jgi:hypothetical protein
MADDIFSRKTDLFGGAFAADSSELNLPGSPDGKGLPVQQLQFTYAQQVTRLYEIGSQAIYYVGGRTNGDATISRVLGPKKLAAEFYSDYGDLCKAGSNTLQFTMTAKCPTGAQTQADAHLVLGMTVITQVGVTMTAQDMLINEQLRMMYSGLKYEVSGTGEAQNVSFASA